MRLKWFFSLLRFETFLILIVSVGSCFLTIHYELNVRSNMMLFGLIISFPLVFSIQSAYKRRERALEYLGDLKAGLTAVAETFRMAKKLSESNRIAANNLLIHAFDEFVTYLKTGVSNPKTVYENFTHITSFALIHKDEMSSKILLRITKYMKYVYTSTAYLTSIKTHRTIIGVRVLSYIFITMFPAVQASFLLYTFGSYLPDSIIYVISIVTSITLSALLLIQKQLEDPFDQDGLDDIKLEEFSLGNLTGEKISINR